MASKPNKREPGKGSKIVKAGGSDVRNFRKPNEAIGLRVTHGHLSLLSRKVFNVMVKAAQDIKVLGTDAPIQTPTSGKYFWIRLTDLARDAYYDSKDVAYLKELLGEMQNIKLKMETERQWTSERLVSSITLVNPNGLNKHSGQVWLGFAFPPEVHEIVMDPTTYTRMPLEYQSQFRTGPGLALFELCLRYATNPSHLTNVDSYETWYELLTGKALPPEGPPPYKYFKRDTLKPAIAEVNAVTDYEVELIEVKNGRRIESLQFRVTQTRQPQLEFPAPPVVDSELLERIMSFGLAKSDASDLMAKYADAVIRSAMRMVEERAGLTGASPLQAKGAYLRWALNHIAKTPEAGQSAASSPPPSLAGPGPAIESVLSRFLDARARDAYALYEQHGDEERKQIFETFKAQNTNRAIKLDKGTATAAARSLFSRWYAQEMWGQPTAAALATFVDQTAVGEGGSR